jgi:hypothetical protein
MHQYRVDAPLEYLQQRIERWSGFGTKNLPDTTRSIPNLYRRKLGMPRQDQSTRQLHCAGIVARFHAVDGNDAVPRIQQVAPEMRHDRIALQYRSAFVG